MATILWIEDHCERVQKLTGEFGDAGHRVTWIDEPSDVERFDKVREHLIDGFFDFLLLDIALEDHFGGIHIYNKLVAGDYRRCWQHTLIWSRYTSPRIREAHYGKHEFPIRIFAETAGISIENILNSTSGGVAKVLQRIRELESMSPDRCHVCGGNLDR